MPYTEDGKFVYTLAKSSRKSGRFVKNQPEQEAEKLPLQFQIAIQQFSPADGKPVITLIVGPGVLVKVIVQDNLAA